MAEHDPTVTVMGGDTPKWRYVVTCPCGLSEQFASRVDAEARADAHESTGE